MSATSVRRGLLSELDFLPVKMVEHFAEIAHIEPPTADRAKAEMILLAFLASSRWARLSLALQVLSQPLEHGMPQLAVGGLRAVLDLGKQLRLHPDAAVRDALRFVALPRALTA
jgi:hypothetical protein